MLNCVTDDRGTICRYLEHPWTSSWQDRREVILPVPGYFQLDTYSCGFVIGLAVVHSYLPDVDPQEFAVTVRPSPSEGVSEPQLIDALRRFGVRVLRHRHPNFGTFDQQLRLGRPVIVPLRWRWMACGPFGPAGSSTSSMTG